MREWIIINWFIVNWSTTCLLLVSELSQRELSSHPLQVRDYWWEDQWWWTEWSLVCTRNLSSQMLSWAQSSRAKSTWEMRILDLELILSSAPRSMPMCLHSHGTSMRSSTNSRALTNQLTVVSGEHTQRIQSARQSSRSYLESSISHVPETTLKVLSLSARRDSLRQ